MINSTNFLVQFGEGDHAKYAEERMTSQGGTSP